MEEEQAQKRREIYEHYQMFNFVEFAVETGMRPVELFNLNWGHLEGLEIARQAPANERKLALFSLYLFTIGLFAILNMSNRTGLFIMALSIISFFIITNCPI